MTSGRGQQLTLRQLIEALEDPAVALTADGSIVYVSPPFAEMLRVARDQLEGRPFEELLATQERLLYRRLLEGCKARRAVSGEFSLRREDGEWVYAHVSLRRLCADPDMVFLVAADVTRHQARLQRERAELEARVQERTVDLANVIQLLQEDIRCREEAEAALRFSEEKWRKLFKASRAVIILTTLADGRIVEANEAFFRALGYQREEVAWRTIGDLGVWKDRRDLARFVGELKARRVVENFEAAFLTKTGEMRIGLISSELLEIEREEVVLSVVLDITERKQMENQLRETLADKETLIRELHHRTKNNFQMLCDFLYLQAGTLEGEEGKAALQESYGRVLAIARLHEQLYQSLESGKIKLAEYLGRLLASFASISPSVPIRFHPCAENVSVDVDRAIHTGLIVNELITNALKHAFTDGRQGEAEVRVRAPGDRLELQVSDNGIGLPPALDLEHSTSLGLRIVHMLARRLEALVTVEASAGTRFTITFPRKAEG